MKRGILWIAVVLTASGCGNRDVKKTEEQPAKNSTEKNEEHLPENMLRIEPLMLRDLRITTTIAELRSGNESASLVGELRVNEDAYAEVGSPVAARVAEIHASLGQHVQQGQVLAIVQSTELGKARGEYVTARARLELAQTTLERKRSLGEQKIVPQREIQEAEASVKSAEADLHSVQATLRALGSGADDTSEGPLLAIRSPIAGTIIDRAVVQGQVSDPARPLFKVADLSRLWLTAHAFERDAVRIQTGGTARVTFAALPGQIFEGKVNLVGRQVDTDSRTVPVRIDIANPNGILRPGMSATAFVPLGTGTSKVLAIPTAAVQRIGEQWYVFVPRTNDTFEVRQIGRGRDLGGQIEILSGLKAGETVVVDGAFLLKTQLDKSRGQGEHDEH